jgi:hypothetical protein
MRDRRGFSGLAEQQAAEKIGLIAVTFGFAHADAPEVCDVQ